MPAPVSRLRGVSADRVEGGPGQDGPPAPGRRGGPFSFAVGRASSTVVVTVRGVLDGAGAGALRRVLADLIEDQGNLAVVVDLRHLALGPESELGVFAWAARCADRRGATLELADPPDDVEAWLEAQGLGRADCGGGGLVRVPSGRGGGQGRTRPVPPGGGE